MIALKSTRLFTVLTVFKMDSCRNTNESSGQNVTDGLSQLDGQGNRTIYHKVYEVGCYSILSLSSLGMVTNLLTIITMVTSRRLRKYPAGKLIIALAVVDCINIIWPFFSFSHTRSEILSFFSYSLLNASVLILLLISINRYVIVCQPLHHHGVTSNKSVVFQLIAVLLGSFMSSDLEAFEIGRAQIITLILYATTVAIITIIILVLTISTYHSLNQSNHALGTQRPFSSLENQMTKAMMSVLFKCIVLLIPYISTCLWTQLIHWDQSIRPVLDVAVWLMLLFTSNFVINFFLYLWYSQEFRSSFIGLVTFRQCRGQSETMNDSLLLYSIQVPDHTQNTP